MIRGRASVLLKAGLFLVHHQFWGIVLFLGSQLKAWGIYLPEPIFGSL